jgi:hypothetical protein
VGPRYALRAAGEYDAEALAVLCERLGADEVEDVCQPCFAAKLDAPSKALFSLAAKAVVCETCSRVFGNAGGLSRHAKVTHL